MRTMAWLIVGMLSVGGCAYSPQQVHILPVIPMLDAPVQRQSGTVSVVGRDQRSTEVIGSRGGVYDKTAVITLAPGAEDALAKTFSDGLRQRGFTVDSYASTSVQVALTELVMNRSKDGMQFKTDLRSAVRVTAQRGADNLSGDYYGSVSYSALKSPGEDDIVIYINEVLGIALGEALEDRRLVMFLAGK